MTKESTLPKSSGLVTNGKTPKLIRNAFIALTGLFLLMLTFTLYENLRPRYVYNYDNTYDGTTQVFTTEAPPLTIPQIEEKVSNETDVSENFSYGDVVSPDDFDEGDEDIRASLQRYEVHTHALTWLDAVMSCRRGGGRLATPGDAEEAKRLGRLLKFLVANSNVTNITDASMTDAMHIGVTSKSAGGRWTTVEGLPLAYESWFLGDLKCHRPTDVPNGFGTILSNGMFLLSFGFQKLIYACDMEPVNIDTESLSEGYELVGNKEFAYKLHPSPLSWIEANDVCKKEGASVVAPVEADQVGNLTEWLFSHKHFPQGANSGGVFIGWNDLAQENFWKDTNGYFVNTYSCKWLHGLPKDDRANNCAAILPSGVCASVSCSDAKPFVCEKRSPFPVTKGAKYEEIEGLGRYAVHTEREDWFRAVFICLSENATLATPTSKTEADVLQRMLEKADRPQSYDLNWLHVGVNDLDRDNIWRTLEGERVYGSGFNEWGEKSRYTETLCGALRYGKYQDIYCSYKYMFVCKKPL